MRIRVAGSTCLIAEHGCELIARNADVVDAKLLRAIASEQVTDAASLLGELPGREDVGKCGDDVAHTILVEYSPLVSAEPRPLRCRVVGRLIDNGQ